MIALRALAALSADIGALAKDSTTQYACFHKQNMVLLYRI